MVGYLLARVAEQNLLNQKTDVTNDHEIIITFFSKLRQQKIPLASRQSQQVHSPKIWTHSQTYSTVYSSVWTDSKMSSSAISSLMFH